MVVLQSTGSLEVSLQTCVILLTTSTFSLYKESGCWQISSRRPLGFSNAQILLYDKLNICSQLFQTPSLASMPNVKHTSAIGCLGTDLTKRCQADAQLTHALEFCPSQCIYRCTVQVQDNSCDARFLWHTCSYACNQVYGYSCIRSPTSHTKYTVQLVWPDMQRYLIGCRVPAHDSLAKGMAVPHALDDDIQEAIVLPSSIAQAHGRGGGRLMGGSLPQQLSSVCCLLLL